MHLYCLLIFDNERNLLYSNYDLSNIHFMYRYSAKNIIRSLALNSFEYVEPCKYYQISESVDDKQIQIYGLYDSNYYIVITDDKYPKHVVFNLIDDVKNKQIDVINIDEKWNKYRDPVNINKINIIQKDIDDTKIIILKSIDDILKRGEKLENLEKRTADLNNSSAVFLKRSKDLNRCCWII